MLIASLGLTGTPRMMMDIVENINHNQYDREHSRILTVCEAEERGNAMEFLTVFAFGDISY